MPLVHPAADVWTLLADIAEETPSAPAFIHGERTLSFAELLDCSARAAQGLADLGVGPGDRVALWLPNLPAYPILYFACVRLGAIAVAVNTRYRAVQRPDHGNVRKRVRRRLLVDLSAGRGSGCGKVATVDDVVAIAKLLRCQQ